MSKYRLNVSISRQDFFLDAEYSVANGWHSQQILKLESARRSDRKFSVVLDCKHIFVRSFSVAEFYQDDFALMPLGSQRSHLGKGRGDAFVHVAGLFGISWEGVIDNTLPTVTPYVFNNSLVDSMMSYIEHTYQMSFSDFFFEQGFAVTEFYMYAMYLHKIGKLTEVYKPAPRLDPIYWSSKDYVESFEKDISSKSVRSVALHRRVLEDLGDGELSRVCETVFGSRDRDRVGSD